MTKSAFPKVSKGLLEALERQFKDTVPTDLKATPDVFKILQGQQSVVRFLRHQYEKQTVEILGA